MKLQASEFYNLFEENERKTVNYLVGLINQTHFSYSQEVLTPFLTLREQFILKKLIEVAPFECYVSFFGGYDLDAERKRAILYLNNEPINHDLYEIEVFEINYNTKFNQLSHGQIYAALHQLGLEYHSFGDIINEGSRWQFFVDKQLSEYVKQELTSIFKIKIKLTETKKVLIPDNTFEDVSILTTSKRIDNVIAAATNQSRSSVKQLAERGNIKRNWVPLKVKQLSQLISLNDYFSIRHFGRFQFIEEIGETKRGKHRLTIKLWRKKKRGIKD